MAAKLANELIAKAIEIARQYTDNITQILLLKITEFLAKNRGMFRVN
jgi:hypothetical protein